MSYSKNRKERPPKLVSRYRPLRSGAALSNVRSGLAFAVTVHAINKRKVIRRSNYIEEIR